MDSSWFSSPLPPARKLRDSFSSKMTTSIIPPPITQSVFLPTRTAASSKTRDAPQTQRPWYHRKQRALEADLQLLLDAQAEGLTRGFDAAPSTPSADSVVDPLSTRSSTPTLHSSSLHARGRTDKVSLRAARKGLYTTMRRLALLKTEEGADVSSALENTVAAHDQLQAWSARKEKLTGRTEEISAGNDAAAAQELRDKASLLEPEIDELENRLAELKNEQRRLRKEAEDTENRVQAKLSSYTRNLEALDREVREFLRDMQPGTSHTVFEQGAEQEQDEPFWSLPTKRRTLDLAVEVLQKEKEVVESRADLIETEREALEEGAVVWKDVVLEVEGFERDLREEMRSLSPSTDARRESPGRRLRTMLDRMDQVATQLESKIKLAETRGWKLLIAAIGAELDAFQKGRMVLENALSAVGGGSGHPLSDEPEDDQIVNSVIRAPMSTVSNDSPVNGIDELDNHFRGQRPLNGPQDLDEDEDAPDPELMISHQDIDTE